jgi:hypothetical protein
VMGGKTQPADGRIPQEQGAMLERMSAAQFSISA